MTEIVALCGGVGGAKLAHGLATLFGDKLTLIVNTGDDFEHVGLHISPDLDTTMYTLAGIASKSTGWGVDGETWNFLDQLRQMGGPDWFRLGDRDLATHVLRAERLRKGATLCEIGLQFCKELGIAARILPMSNDRVRTIVHTEEGALEFQDYFVRLQANVTVKSIEFAGARHATIAPEIAALLRKRPSAIVICPSNPYLSVDPILAISEIRSWLEQNEAPIIAVSPIVGGAAIKGPLARIMIDLGYEPSVTQIADHYGDLIDGLVIDSLDAGFAEAIERKGIRVHVANTVMRTHEDRVELAKTCVGFSKTFDGKGVKSNGR